MKDQIKKEVLEQLVYIIVVLVVLVGVYYRGHDDGVDVGVAIHRCVDELGCDCTEEALKEKYIPLSKSMLTHYPICFTMDFEGD